MLDRFQSALIAVLVDHVDHRLGNAELRYEHVNRLFERRMNQSMYYFMEDT